jgi:glutaconate CoA-transferase, subunit A
VPDKRRTHDEVVAELRDGMTIGIGGWGSRRKPMSLVRAILRSDVTDLRVVSYGGPDVGLLCAAGKVREVVYGFVSLDSIPLEPHFRQARQAGRIRAVEWDEGMFNLGLQAAAQRLPFLPTRAGLGSDVLRADPTLKLVEDPYGGGRFVAVPALNLDAALVHVNRADARGNGQILGHDPYFDDLFAAAAERTYVSCERIVDTADLLAEGALSTLRLSRAVTHAVVEAPGGAHFTSCAPDYERDEAFQKHYARSAGDADAWANFRRRFLEVDEAGYRTAVGDLQEAAQAAGTGSRS